MTWRFVFASVAGSSHNQSNSPCQDACFVKVDKSPAKESILSIFVADGSGSARYGGEGARLAVETAKSFMAEKIKQDEFSPDLTWATDILKAVRSRLLFAVEVPQNKISDFACTFIGVISTRTTTMVMQIGDGGVVINPKGNLELAIRPMTGEYVNTTCFVTDDDAFSLLEKKIYTDPISKVAAFTDGIQSLALININNEVYEPFFSPFFNVICEVVDEQVDQLFDLLSDFLASNAVNERTDDDKTLALAVWQT